MGAIPVDASPSMRTKQAGQASDASLLDRRDTTVTVGVTTNNSRHRQPKCDGINIPRTTTYTIQQRMLHHTHLWFYTVARTARDVLRWDVDGPHPRPLFCGRGEPEAEPGARQRHFARARPLSCGRGGRG